MAFETTPDRLCPACSDAGITRFPRGLGELRQLEGLQADGCELVAPYSSLYAKNPLLLVALHDREALSVDLSDCKLDAVPGDLMQQTQLTSLNLSKNNIQVRLVLAASSGKPSNLPCGFCTVWSQLRLTAFGRLGWSATCCALLSTL
jgi:Leucine-rich repeat (LRR) protein